MADRRALLEEVIAARSAAVATAREPDPPAESQVWPLGIVRLAMWTIAPGRTLLERRRGARDIAVVALAWMEAVDHELGGEPEHASAAPSARAPDATA